MDKFYYIYNQKRMDVKYFSDSFMATFQPNIKNSKLKKNDKSLFVETCRFSLWYCDEKDFFDILRIIALKLTNIEYDTLKEFIIIFQTVNVSDFNNFVEDTIALHI